MGKVNADWGKLAVFARGKPGGMGVLEALIGLDAQSILSSRLSSLVS